MADRNQDTDPRDPEAPEAINRSQRDELTQAQTVGQQALHKDDMAGTDPAPNTGVSVTPRDAEDTVDHMNQMAKSGHIDKDAYRGERNDADAEDPLGELGKDVDRDVKLSDES